MREMDFMAVAAPTRRVGACVYAVSCRPEMARAYHTCVGADNTSDEKHVTSGSNQARRMPNVMDPKASCHQLRQILHLTRWDEMVGEPASISKPYISGLSFASQEVRAFRSLTLA